MKDKQTALNEEIDELIEKLTETSAVCIANELVVLSSVFYRAARYLGEFKELRWRMDKLEK